MNRLRIIARELATKAAGRDRLRTLDSHLSLIGYFITSQGLGTGSWKRFRIGITTPASATTLSLGLIWRSVVEGR